MQQVDWAARPAMLKHFAAPPPLSAGAKGPLNSRLEIPRVRQQVNPIEREQSNR
jgi:hypothetical protein